MTREEEMQFKVRCLSEKLCWKPGRSAVTRSPREPARVQQRPRPESCPHCTAGRTCCRGPPRRRPRPPGHSAQRGCGHRRGHHSARFDRKPEGRPLGHAPGWGPEGPGEGCRPRKGCAGPLNPAVQQGNLNADQMSAKPGRITCKPGDQRSDRQLEEATPPSPPVPPPMKTVCVRRPPFPCRLCSVFLKLRRTC